MMHKVYLGLGSNLGDREANIREAIRLIGERVGTVVRQSSLIETEPWGFESANTFLNGAILCETALTPREVLAATQQIERELGKTDEHATERTPSPLTNNPSPLTTHHSPLTNNHSPLTNNHSPLYKDRPIDIDILLYDDLRLREPGLTIPHPLMYERPFVMQPLHEIMEES